MTPVPTVDLERQVDSLPTQKALWAYLSQCKSELISVTEKMALAVAKAQREGWELPKFLKKNTVAWLMKIANRQVDPVLYDHLNSHTKALRLFSGLPIQEQKRIAEEGAIEIVEPSGDKRRMDLLELEDQDLKLLFDRDGSLRSEGAQKHYHNTTMTAPQPIEIENDTAKLEVDQRSHSLLVKFRGGVVKIPAKDLARYLEQALAK